MEILSVEKLNFSYPTNSAKALCDVSFSANVGDFILLCGETGSGKTTLLKMLKKEIAPIGQKTGFISFRGENIEASSAGDIGFVMQNPENQIVCDKVWHELAFGLENMGVSNSAIRTRVAEMASYFGISEWFSKNTDELSGGQKQILNLASVMVMLPNLILLDEPTSQLDPIASLEFINTLKKINKDFGTTVILSEHRTEQVLPLADKLMVMKQGRVICFDSTQNVCETLTDDNIIKGLPTCVRIWNGTGRIGACPLDVSGGKRYINDNFENSINTAENKTIEFSDETAVKCRDVCFRYDKNGKDVIESLSLEVNKGEIYCILGANGAGKSTLLKLLSGLIKAYKGKIEIAGKNIKSFKGNELNRQKVSILPQAVQNIFLKDTVGEDLKAYCKALGFDEHTAEVAINDVVEAFDISTLMAKHPFDLSGGEQQKCAVAKVMLSKPEILLMDEPVKSLDALAKQNVASIIKNIAYNGTTVIIVTHDIDFAAETAHRCALLFNGEIVSCAQPGYFFSDNSFYTTAASVISRDYYNHAVTTDDVIGLCNKNDRKVK